MSRALTASARAAYVARRLPSSFPIPSGFWKDHVREHSLDEPAVVRCPFPAPLVKPDDIFEALITAAEMERTGTPCELRLYLGDREQVHRHTIDRLGADYWDALPRRDDRSLSGYAERVRQRHGHECFALLLNESQSVVPEIWFRVRDFLCGLFEESGFPAGGADANIFAGNYRRTPFGVHTDTRDVFTWIVEGQKKFLVWPREALDGIMGPGKRDAKDYADLRAHAIALEGDAGDLLYWPHPYWHVAESDRDGLVSTLSVGLDRTLPAEAWMRDAMLDLVRGPLESSDRITHHPFDPTSLGRSFRALPLQLRRALEAHRRRSAGADLERELRLKWMCWLTGFGMQLPPRAPPVELFDGDRVRGHAHHPITCASWRDQLLCSANGYGFAIAHSPELAAFIRKLNSRREFLVADLRWSSSQLLTPSTVDAMLEAFISFRALQHVPDST
jgi:hypothetical protein